MCVQNRLVFFSLNQTRTRMRLIRLYLSQFNLQCQTRATHSEDHSCRPLRLQMPASSVYLARITAKRNLLPTVEEGPDSYAAADWVYS